ncbi:MAG: T9SS type A sorting domain-containing protein [Balneolaceae bacterium]
MALFLTVSVSTDVVAQEGEQVNEQDSLALVAYYHSTNGDEWVNNAGWLTSDPLYSWVGIVRVENVNGEGEPEDWRVTRVDMPRNNMTVPGPMPPEIKDLQYMQWWKADVNLHSGELPVEISEMPRLERLLMRTNLFTGDVAWSEFAKMPSMEQFRIRDNYFTGELPSVLGGNGEWSSLRRLFLDDNRFTGQIPEVHADLTTLNQVYFSNNQLTGPIPDWSQLEGMEYYRISGNDLDPGPIPEWIFDSWGETLIRFQIQNTNRTGSLSPKIAQMEALEQFVIGGLGDTIGEGESTADIPDMSFMPSLRRINFYGGGWSGPLPDWIGDVVSLEDVHFQNMDITGTIPANLVAADGIVSVHLEELNLEGGLPEAWATATSLQEITLIDNENMEVGEIPLWIGANLGSLDVLRLANVGVTGELPSNLGNINFESLNLRDNPELTGQVPSWFSQRNYSQLEISRTGLTLNETNTIPDWVGTKNNLSYLGLGGLGLEGEIPDYFGEGLISVNLNVLALDDNNLTGGIPSSLGNVIRMDSLNLSNNNLSGSIPENLANAGRVTADLSLLSALMLSNNIDLEGDIPLAFTNAEFMRVLEYENTGLCEPQDGSYQAWLDGIPDFAAESYPIAYYSVKNENICGDVSNEYNETVRSYRLNQNYPNPFNPTTSISFEIPEASNVKLNVYNMLGQRVATLVDDIKVAGVHSINFDASNLSSGSYIYRLEVGEKVLTQSMMLIK